MSYLVQIFLGIISLAVISFFSKRSFLGFILLITVPILYFFRFSPLELIISITLGVLLKLLLSKKSNYKLLLLFFVITAFGVFISGHNIYENVGIENVANAQRGEHQNYQTNTFAKILHNKSTVITYYLWNFSDRLSLTTIFASGSYPDFSKYLPLGFLFPWYLFGLLSSIKNRYQEYLNTKFILALITLFIFSSIFTIGSATIFILSVVWFICFESVSQMEKMPKKLIFLTILLNLACLGMFFLPVKVMQNT